MYKKMKSILDNLKSETIKLYNELDKKTNGRYKIGVNGLGEIVLSDMRKIKTLAQGELNCQEAMKKLIKGE